MWCSRRIHGNTHLKYKCFITVLKYSVWINKLLSTTVPRLLRCNSKRYMRTILHNKSQWLLIVESTWTSMKKPLNYSNELGSTPGCNQAMLKCLLTRNSYLLWGPWPWMLNSLKNEEQEGNFTPHFWVTGSMAAQWFLAARRSWVCIFNCFFYFPTHPLVRFIVTLCYLCIVISTCFQKYASFWRAFTWYLSNDVQ